MAYAFIVSSIFCGLNFRHDPEPNSVAMLVAKNVNSIEQFNQTWIARRRNKSRNEVWSRVGLMLMAFSTIELGKWRKIQSSCGIVAEIIVFQNIWISILSSDSHWAHKKCSQSHRNITEEKLFRTLQNLYNSVAYVKILWNVKLNDFASSRRRTILVQALQWFSTGATSPKEEKWASEESNFTTLVLVVVKKAILYL